MMKISSFLVFVALFAVAVSGSGPSEATDLTRTTGRQRGQEVTSARGARGMLSRKVAGISFNAQGDGAAGASEEYSTDLHERKHKKHLHNHHKKHPHFGDRKMLSPPCITEQECAAKKLFCFKKCSDLMNGQEDPKCLIRCVNCIPTC